jgi:hypothetical protein
LIIEELWLVQDSDNLYVKICSGQTKKDLYGNCLQLTQEIPDQIYDTERVVLTVLIVSVFAINSVLTAINFILITKFDLNLPPSYFGELLLLCHMLGTGLHLPAALTVFN